MVALKVANSVVQKAVESVDWTAVSLAGRMAAMTALGMAAMKVASSVVQLVWLSVGEMAASKGDSLDGPTVARWADHLAAHWAVTLAAQLAATLA
jgi:hypothetical protein